MTAFPCVFDELYVVSDIHMGGHKNGEEDFQIFNQGCRLAAFIRHIATYEPGKDLALVLNGDVIDSLAEDDVPAYVTLEAEIANRMMAHLYTDASFKPVWDALAEFVQASHRYLVIIAGNHDIELALPVVEDSIRRHLAADSAEAWGRIHFSTHGSGYTCRVSVTRRPSSNQLPPMVKYATNSKEAYHVNRYQIGVLATTY